MRSGNDDGASRLHVQRPNESTHAHEGLTLKRASAEYVDAFVAMRDAFSAGGEDQWRGGAVIAHADPAAYLEILRSWSEGRNLPPNWGPAVCYLILADDSLVVGQIDVRHPITGFLRQWGGHIGFHVHPGFRNRGVATWALRAALQTLATSGVPEALLTCAHDNAASIRVIEKCGGRRIADSTRRRYLIAT